MNAAKGTNQVDRRLHKGRHRLRRRADFARVFAHKCSAGSAWMVVYVAPNGLQWCRLGLSVGKRVGNAVRRNRVRRRIRESFRLMKTTIPRGFDVVVVARPGIEEVEGQKVEGRKSGPSTVDLRLSDLLSRLIIKATGQHHMGKAAGSRPRPSCPEPPG